MATKPTFKDVFERNKYDLVTVANKSKGWFEKEVTMLTKQQLTPGKILSGNADQLVTKVMPGRLYMYAYDPKMKKELPYYDRFPLVFPFSATQNGFMGLNMHYLPYKLRIVLLDRLMTFKSNNRLDETTRLKYSWQVIDGVSKFAAAQCQPPVFPGKRTQRYLLESLTFMKNQAKWAAATEYAKDRNWEFKIITEHELGL